MTNQQLNKGSQVLQKYDYGYGKIDENTGNLDLTKNNGQLGKIESFVGTQKQATQKFSYDSIGRLSDAKEYKGTDNSLTYKEHFDFDRFGNLYRKAANNSTSGQSNPVAYSPIEDNQIDKTTNRFTSATNTTYNEAGMVVGDNKFRSMNFAYDANGRQVKATKANVADAWSVYDALGNRVATKVNDIWQFVIYDAFGKLVAEYGTQGEGIGGVSYVLQDWQGSVRASVNNNGFIQARFDFTAFGEEVSLGVGLRSLEQGYTGDATTKQGYGLTEKDSSGQNHTWFRKQEQKAGRWTSPDPYKGSMKLRNPQSFNRYSYVEGEPTNFVDPSGLLVIAICRDVETYDEHTATVYWKRECYLIDFGGGGSFGNFFKAPELDDLLNSAEAVIEKATGECADLLGKDALNKFKELRKAGNITYAKKAGDMSPSTGGKHEDGKITLNPFSFSLDPDFKALTMGTGKNATNDRAKLITDGFNKTFKETGAASQADYAVATVLHEFLHAIGIFKPDSSTDISGKVDNSKSVENQKKVIEKCFSKKK